MGAKHEMTSSADPFALLSRGGEMGERIRAFDWTQTPLGPPEAWSPALRTTLRIMLANRFPHILWWGPHYIQFYNDPYRPIPGNKHPAKALGRPASECWSEIWHIIGPLIETPFKSVGSPHWLPLLSRGASSRRGSSRSIVLSFQPNRLLINLEKLFQYLKIIQ
jgi:hypothetical protein